MDDFDIYIYMCVCVCVCVQTYLMLSRKKNNTSSIFHMKINSRCYAKRLVHKLNHCSCYTEGRIQNFFNVKKIYLGVVNVFFSKKKTIRELILYDLVNLTNSK